MAKLTDRQRKQIIAEYINGGVSQQQLAKKYGVSRQAIAKLLNTEKSCEKLLQKKEENTRSMLEFLDEQKDTAQSLMQKILQASEKDIERASLRDKMGALKILSEVFAGKREEETDATPTKIIVRAVDASEADDGSSD